MNAYDLRIYDVAEGQTETLIGVLREVALPLMPEHGITPVGFWANPTTNRIYQISAHDSLAAVSDNWDRLHADPRWLSGLHERRGETSAVKSVATILLTAIEGMPPSAA